MASQIFKRPVVLADAKQCSKEKRKHHSSMIFLIIVRSWPSIGFHPISVGCNAARDCLEAFRKSWISVNCSYWLLVSIASNWKSIQSESISVEYIDGTFAYSVVLLRSIDCHYNSNKELLYQHEHDMKMLSMVMWILKRKEEGFLIIKIKYLLIDLISSMEIIRVFLFFLGRKRKSEW